MMSEKGKRLRLIVVILFLLLFGRTASVVAQENEEDPDPPNIVLFIADDMYYTDSGAYGNEDVHTPNIDQLAETGVKFTRAFTATPMCTPTRHQLFTGIYPVRSGGYPNHSEVYKGTRSMFHHFRKLGYSVALVGKQHIGPPSSFPYTYLGGRNFDAGKGTPIPLENARTFIKHNDKHTYVRKNSSQPWLLTVASLQPHEPWNRGQPELYPPDELTVPSFLVDVPKTRKQLSKYYAEVTYMDRQVGRVIQMLDDLDELDETLFMFFSEHGASMPFGKYSLYELGMRSQLIVRWPGEVEPGTTTDAMVEFVDVVPTLIEAAGGDPESFSTGIGGGPDGGKGFDGSSFLSVLKGKTDQHKEYVFGVHTTPGGSKHPYPIRSVRSERYKLIWNLNHEKTVPSVKKFDLISAWKKVMKENEHARKRVEYAKKRPEFELYDLQEDPFELNNLASDPEQKQTVNELKAKMQAWMDQQGDKGIETDKNKINRFMRWRRKGLLEDDYNPPSGY